MDKEIDRVLEQIADPAERHAVATDAAQGIYKRGEREYPAWIGQSHTARIMGGTHAR